MGGLIPTPNDLEVIAKLNARFSSYGLAHLRHYQTASGDTLFNAANRSLERVSVRLGIHPTMLGGRGRWLYFLANVLRAQSPATYNLIRQILGQALQPANNVNSVLFNAIEDPLAGANNYYLYPSNAANDTTQGGAPQVSRDSPANHPIWLITLVCPAAAVIPFGIEPPPDPNEPPNPIVP